MWLGVGKQEGDLLPMESLTSIISCKIMQTQATVTQRSCSSCDVNKEEQVPGPIKIRGCTETL